MMKFLLLAVLFLASCDCQKVSPWRRISSESWEPISFGGEGSAQWENDTLHLALGVELTGARYTGNFPAPPYEIELEARKLNGSDFFCGLTVPVQEASITLIVGGWGGGVVGISSVDGKDASQNQTTTYHDFERGRWYRIRLQVGRNHLAAWIDDAQVLDLDATGKVLGLRPGPIEQCAPFGLAAWQTEAEIRDLRWRPLVE